MFQFEERMFCMTIYFSKISIGILDYLQKHYKMAQRKKCLQLISLYTSFITYFVVKFISLVVAFKIFYKEKYEYSYIFKQ